MEAAGAVDLVVNSKMLKKANVEVGVFTADKDSSSWSAIQNASDHVIIKQFDMNHSKKRIGNQMYEIQKDRKRDPNQELTNSVITHIQTCFTFAVHQNVANVEKIKQALQNILYNLFNMHKNSGG